jgi:hypothetical protein
MWARKLIDKLVAAELPVGKVIPIRPAADLQTPLNRA